MATPSEAVDLSQERAVFERRSPDLLREHLGKVALVRGTEHFEIFDTPQEAIKAGLDRWGIDGTFMIRRIKPIDSDEFDRLG